MAGAIRPKYILELAVPREWKDFGWEGTFLAGVDVSSAQHTTLSANADVVSIPLNIDSQVGANLTAVQNGLEALNIPMDWVTATHTYREVLRNAMKLFQFINRFTARQAVRFFDAVSLNTLVSDLTPGQRSALSSAAESLGLDASGITSDMQLRQALRIVLVQLPPITLMGEAF
jgi:hypothetical protein